jgi:hypothetical protein
MSDDLPQEVKAFFTSQSPAQLDAPTNLIRDIQANQKCLRGEFPEQTVTPGRGHIAHFYTFVDFSKHGP